MRTMDRENRPSSTCSSSAGRTLPQVDLLVRAKVDRVLGKEKTADGQTVSRHLFDEVRNAPARGAAKVEVRRLSARVKASKQARKDGRADRVAKGRLLGDCATSR